MSVCLSACLRQITGNLSSVHRPKVQRDEVLFASLVDQRRSSNSIIRSSTIQRVVAFLTAPAKVCKLLHFDKVTFDFCCFQMFLFLRKKRIKLSKLSSKIFLASVRPSVPYHQSTCFIALANPEVKKSSCSTNTSSCVLLT